ncbi:Galactose mutarotase [Chitinophaga sp. CF118]|uniref:aldose 1-epimerase family protein n=1 Tax=Chitinophaga sp. CF118 TaxID=1884367 RepID=UPI0008EEA7F8|nr:aldose 1-epimerase family protein [Chitinophaga sp. CF118]SFD57628.1 Galactose mutarotase [Chitinophaga sp. CF118]
MPELSNDHLRIVISEKGAELQQIIRKDFQLEYLWNADPAFWAKKSPVLFPIVGTLKNNTYSYKGKNYTLGRHGFARDHVFIVSEQTDTRIVFSLTDTEHTLPVYPFNFRFNVIYTLLGDQLTVTYLVENTGADTMYFSVGAHPAFKVPLIEGLKYEDYYLSFNAKENANLWPLSAEGLIEITSVPYLEQADKLPLQHSLFYQDALVFKHMDSTAITLKSDYAPHGIEMQFEGFPFMGIWAAKDADFVCIEPWCGIADSVNASGELFEKEGINKLLAGQQFERHWSARFF